MFEIPACGAVLERSRLRSTKREFRLRYVKPWVGFRLSLGDNSELGGAVGGERPYVRWNFFTDATVMVGDQIWVKDGKPVIK